jgi:hypothetical protein
MLRNYAKMGAHRSKQLAKSWANLTKFGREKCWQCAKSCEIRARKMLKITLKMGAHRSKQLAK